MENNMVLNSEVDFDNMLRNMSYEQVLALKEKTKEYEQRTLDRRVAELERWRIQSSSEVDGISNEFKELKIVNEKNIEELEKAKENLLNLNDKTNTLEFEDNKTLGEIKKAANANIVKRCGGKGTPEYILLYRTYISDLYRKVGESLAGGKRIGKVKVEDGSAAVTMAKRYIPSNYIINKRISAYLDMQNNKTLSIDKSKALELYLEENGGII